MTKYHLCTPRQAEDACARFFLDSSPAKVLVREDTAFIADNWLDLGTLEVFAAERAEPELKSSIRFGSFEWQVPDQEKVASDLRRLLNFASYDSDTKKKDAAEEKLRVIMQAMAGIAVRTGLAWPRVDASSLAEMPFRRPTTIVADTSGILQGTMSFVADYLYPMARLKVPAILHMEVINQADRFLKTRRAEKVRREALLLEHLRSQTGQRALLRLELREDTEVERNLLLGDPIRNAFKEDRDPDMRDLNLSVAFKSYVDRMILESARQHQSHATPGHPVYLLTADQGLAKMALAEGVRPLFFRAIAQNQLFGKVLTGALLHPFTGKLTSRSLSSVLWELGTAFGQVRLYRDDSYIEIVSIHKDLGWSSYHSIDDLLWFSCSNLKEWPQNSARVSPTAEDIFDEPDEDQISSSSSVVADEPKSSQPPKLKSRAKPTTKPAKSTRTAKLSGSNKAGVAFYRMTADGLVRLVNQLSDQSKLTDQDVGEITDVKHPTSIAGYRLFLTSGDFISLVDRFWEPTERLLQLSAAFKEGDMEQIRTALALAPSFERFSALLREVQDTRKPFQSSLPPRVNPTYLALGELSGIGTNIPGEGYFATFLRPTVEAFSKLALDRYMDLKPVGNWAGVGEWLETLVKADGLHPVVTRERLQEAVAANLLHLSTEGSTTDTRHDEHTLKALTTVLRPGSPNVDVETVHLYRGDFLVPGKSSSSLRLEAVK